MDSFTEVTGESWFSRMMGSFKSVLIGLLLIVVGGVLLFWNEGRAVTTERSLTEGGGAVVDVAADKVEPANDHKLVHVSGEATAKDPLKDAEYGVTTAGPALMLKRTVEMYQWKQNQKSEKQTKIGGGTETKTVYTYEKAWSSELIKSSEFKQPQGHQNPASMPPSETFVGKPVTLGGFTMTEAQVKRIEAWKPVTPDAQAAKDAPSGGSMRVVGDQFYRGADPNQPAVGDIRVKFTYVPPTTVSVIAEQAGTSFQPFQTKSGDALDMLEMGNVGSKEMFKKAQDQNAQMTWILRGVGWLLMSIGIGSLFSPLTTFASVLPFLGDILGFGIFLFAMVVGGVVSLFIIALGWIAYRPLLGVMLFAAGFGLLFAFKYMGKQRTA